MFFFSQKLFFYYCKLEFDGAVKIETSLEVQMRKCYRKANDIFSRFFYLKGAIAGNKHYNCFYKPD